MCGVYVKYPFCSELWLNLVLVYYVRSIHFFYCFHVFYFSAIEFWWIPLYSYFYSWSSSGCFHCGDICTFEIWFWRPFEKKQIFSLSLFFSSFWLVLRCPFSSNNRLIKTVVSNFLHSLCFWSFASNLIGIYGSWYLLF